MSDTNNNRNEPTGPDDDAAVALTGATGDATPAMRLRSEAPRVTRLSRKVLAGLGVVTALGVGGALIYALQTREAGPGGEGKHPA